MTDLNTDPKIETFLSITKEKEEIKYQIIIAVRELLLQIFPHSEERFIYGGIGFFIDGKIFGGIYTNRQLVKIEFSNGWRMKDENTLLIGSGKFRRHLELNTVSEVVSKKAEYYIKQARD